MREIVGFAAGLLAGSVGAVVATSESGRRLRERLIAEAEPDVRTALDEWDPLLRELARAVRLGSSELQATAAQVREYLGRLATEGQDVDGDGPADGGHSPDMDGES